MLPLDERSLFVQLKSKLDLRTARIAVVGLGYVGLPLAMELGSAGFRVIGIDVAPQKVEQLLSGNSYVQDVPSDMVGRLVADGRFTATTDFGVLSDVDAVSICVPTPLRKTKDPDMSYIVSAVSQLKKYTRPGQLVVLESTTYPGTTEEMVVSQLTQEGLRVGEDVFVAFSPERVDPGNVSFNTRNTPKVVGGITAACTELAVKLYGYVSTTVVPVSSARVAETVKLLENTFRSINIALVNEFAMMSERMGIDIWEVISAASTKPFGFMPFTPGPGIGGHCIPLDPIYLSWKARTYDFYSRFIDIASDINGNMPRYVVERFAELLSAFERPLKGSRVLLLGVAYKKNVDDVRESPALEIMRHLLDRSAIVEYSDPFVPSLEHEGLSLKSVALTANVIAQYDAVLVVTNHDSFDYELIARHARCVFDTRNGFGRQMTGNIFRLGTGEVSSAATTVTHQFIPARDVAPSSQEG